MEKTKVEAALQDYLHSKTKSAYEIAMAHGVEVKDLQCAFAEYQANAYALKQREQR